MLDKSKFLEIVTKSNVDEVWVNFTEPFAHVHDKEGEEIYIYKEVRPTDWSECEFKLMSFFAPQYSSDEEADVLSVGLWSHVICKNGMLYEEFLEKRKNLHCIYRKGVDILG